MVAPAAGGLDRTGDFTHLVDKIEIDASAFGGGLVAGGAVQLVANANPTSAGKVGGVFLHDTDSGFLSWDADGGGAGAAAAFFRLQNLPVLTAADFVVVA
jgi:Ca2+-binding RTX toxin-like protein